MAVSSAAYKFLMVDIGESGRQSDGSVYYNIDLGFAIENDLINMPAKKTSLTQIENYLMFLLAMMRLVINHI